MTKRIAVLSGAEAASAGIRNLVVIAIAGAAHELQLPLLVEGGMQGSHYSVELDIPETEQQRLKDEKEAMRAALRRRLDPMLVRAAMRAIFATPGQYEEP